MLKALTKLTATEVSCRAVGPNTLTAGIKRWLAFAASAIHSGSRKENTWGIDLVIGTGASTHLPMLTYKNECGGAKVVTCMTPDFPFKEWMDLCLVPRHDRPKKRQNVFVTTGPPNNVTHADKHDRDRGLILVGGLDPKSHKWNSDIVATQLETLIERESDCTWTISSSPRTPQETIRKIDTLASQHAGVEFFNSAQTPPGWIEQQYQRNNTVWVTADSISMVYEALTAGCRVGVLPVHWKRKNNKFQHSVDYLAAHNHVTLYQRWLSGGYSSGRGTRFDEASRCAEEILRRWWPERLQ